MPHRVRINSIILGAMKDGLMLLIFRVLLFVTVVVPVGLPVVAQPVDYAMLAAIRDEGLRRSQAMDHISWLSDVYGPRVTGTPAIEQAGAWAMEKLRAWGLSNVRAERFG